MPILCSIFTLPLTFANYPYNLNYALNSKQRRYSYAAFAQPKYQITNRLSATLGLRFNHDTFRSSNATLFDVFGPTVFATTHENAVTGKGEINFDITSQNMAYASISRGYKPGGVSNNSAPLLVPLTYKPEHVWAYELGSKNKFADGKATFNTAAFYYDYQNLQYQEEDPIPYQGGVSNVPKTHIWGVEAEGSFQVVPALTIDGNITYLNGKLVGDYITLDPSLAHQATLAAAALGHGPFDPYTIALRAQQVRNTNGNKPPKLPTYQGAIGLTHTLDVSNAGTLRTRAELIYRGKFQYRIFNDGARDVVPGYRQVNLNFEFMPRGMESLTIGLTMTNLFNSNGIASDTPTPSVVLRRVTSTFRRVRLSVRSSMTSSDGPAHAVDEVPPLGRLATLAAQHVLTMYAGAITVPLLIASSLHLSSQDTAYLVSADLFACGLVTIIQSFAIGPIGVRLPVIMGVTFVGVMPSIAIAMQDGLSLPGVYGATIAAGLIVLPFVQFAGKLRAVLTPTVTGTAMLLIGLSLMGVAVDWAAGGRSAADYGSPRNLLTAAITIGAIIAATKFGSGFIANCSILIGMATGYVAAAVLGLVDLSQVASAPTVRLVEPFHFGLPVFDPAAIASMVVVLLVTLVESSGMLTMLGEMVDRPLSSRQLARGLRADCVGAIVGGVFNSFPYTSYAQNIALVSMTGVKSRFVCVGAAVLMLALALFPKLSAVIAAMPSSVLGGSALVLFGVVAATGVRSLAFAGLDRSRENLLVVAISLGIGVIPSVSERFFAAAPTALAPFTHSGVLLGIVSAVLLNLLFHGGTRPVALAPVSHIEK